MKCSYLLAVTFFLAAQVLSAATLDANISGLAGTANAPVDTWTDVGISTDLTLPSGGANVLVYATFSTGTPDDTTSQARTGNWRLTDGTTYSLPIQRYLEKGGEDAGVASATHLFEFTTSGVKTLKLQHMTSDTIGNKLAKTFDVSLAAVSLKTSDGCTLSNSQDATGT